MSKLIKIPYSNLPDINAFTESYNIRYRLKSDDGNRVSAWSPIYQTDPNLSYQRSAGGILLEKETGFTRVIWDPVQVVVDGNIASNLEYYDVWTRYSNSYGSAAKWLYRERVFSTSLNIFQPVPPGGIGNTLVRYFSIEIYAPTVQGTTLRRRSFDTYQDSSNIDLINDTISFIQNIDFVTGEAIIYSVDQIYGKFPQQTGLEISGLVNGQQYYVRVVDTNKISLYNSKEDAINDKDKINLESHPNSMGFFSAASCTLCNYLLQGYYYFIV